MIYLAISNKDKWPIPHPDAKDYNSVTAPTNVCDDSAL
jgi:hypothetical protein